MCYSALVNQNFKSLKLTYQARIDESLMEDLFQRRLAGESIRIPKAMEANFLDGKHPASAKLIKKYGDAMLAETKAELENQRERLTAAQKKLKTKNTKTLEKEAGVATRQIARLESKLKKITQTKTDPADARIFPFDYAPVILSRDGERVVVPMRYHLRPNGMRADFDRKYPGCYNARRDSLGGFWKSQFGRRHGVITLSAFYEHVELTRDDRVSGLKKGNKAILEFQPSSGEEMIVPVIWDSWKDKDGTTLLSFSIVTDDPPPEVLEAGHDRCPIFLKPSRVNDWLNPEGLSERALQEILDDRVEPVYAHKVAA